MTLVEVVDGCLLGCLQLVRSDQRVEALRQLTDALLQVVVIEHELLQLRLWTDEWELSAVHLAACMYLDKRGAGLPCLLYLLENVLHAVSYRRCRGLHLFPVDVCLCKHSILQKRL